MTIAAQIVITLLISNEEYVARADPPSLFWPPVSHIVLPASCGQIVHEMIIPSPA